MLRFFAFPVLLFDTNAASENEPKADQQKKRFRNGFYSVLKGSACRRGVTIYMYMDVYVCRFIHTHKKIFAYMYIQIRIYIYVYIHLDR